MIVNTIKNKTKHQNMGIGNEAGYRIFSGPPPGDPGLTKASFAGRHPALCHYIRNACFLWKSLKTR